MKKALIHLHLAVFLAGFTGVLGRWIALNESLLVWYRLLITVITLGILALWQGSFPTIARKNLAAVLFIGAIVALHWVFFYGSIKFSNVSIALVCFSTVGFFSSVIEPLVMRKKVAGVELLLGLLAIAGVYLIFHFDARYKTGIIYGLIAAVLAALFTVLNKTVLASEDAKTISFYELTGGFVVLSFILPFYLRFFDVPFSLPQQWDWFWLLILSWFCTVLAFYLSLSALKKVSSFTVNLTYNLEPIYGILLAFVIYEENEYLGLSFYAGLALILVAVALQMTRLYIGRQRSAALEN